MVHSPERKSDRSITTDVHSMGALSRNGHTDGEVLTKIHKEILHCLEKGYTKPQTAKKLGLNVYTLDALLREIYKIIDAHTMTEAVAKAIREKMI
ncbi:MAG: hypothetical protein AB1728_14865 [Bacteroidota bacterium]